MPDSLICLRIGRWYQRFDDRSRMNREVHVRFWEGVGVKFSRATQLTSKTPDPFFLAFFLARASAPKPSSGVAFRLSGPACYLH